MLNKFIMSKFEVPGATLHYESTGSGPLLLCVSGGGGSYEVWLRLSKELSDRFTVVSYDRRGFSRSHLSGEQDYEHRLQRDADDAAALIQHFSPDEPATVIGSSSGAIVSLELLRRHPDLIRVLVCHEPPAFKLQANTDEIFAKQQDIYDTYRRSGIPPAMEKFADLIKANAEKPFLMKSFEAGAGTYNFVNGMYWLEREFLVYPMTDFTSKMFQPYRTKLLPANAELTDHDTCQYQANVTLAKDLGLELVHLPGAHVGYASHAKQFAVVLMDALKEKDGFYGNL